jgi:hypothetical protein
VIAATVMECPAISCRQLQVHQTIKATPVTHGVAPMQGVQLWAVA